MAKQKIKIVILFILIITILIGVWRFYHKLEYNKQSFSVDIYGYVSPQAIHVININREYNLDKLYLFDPSLRNLTEVLGDNPAFPVIISEFPDNERILITRAGRDRETEIKDYIQTYIAPYFLPKERKYRDAAILFYALPEDKFLICTFYKGIFAVSRNYKPIEVFIDSDPENTFFSDEKNTEFITKIRNSNPVCIFAKTNDNTLALDYSAQNDSILLSGYILDNRQNAKEYSISADYNLIPYLIRFPDGLCIDSIDVREESKPVNIKIYLNKKF
jgi:hypothetical protein